MFERFTDRARRIMVLAQEEARMLNHDYVGTEHILLALVHERNGIAARALKPLGITEGAVRQQVSEIVGRGEPGNRSGHVPFAPQAKKVLELSLREAMQLGHNYIGTEHILLGLVREGDGPAAQVLVRLGSAPEKVRQQVIALVHEYEGTQEPEPGRAARCSRPGSGGQPDLLPQLLHRLDAVESRLSALEHRVGTGPDVTDLTGQISQVRREKEGAIDAQDFERAAALRDQERQLLSERDSRRERWAAVHQNLPSLSEEVEPLRRLLRQHGLDSEDGIT